MNELIVEHQKEYDVSPDIVIRAPGRFHLIGDHSWFCKDKTLSMAIDLPVYVAISVRDDQIVRFNYIQMNEKKKISLSSIKFRKEDRWANNLKAMIYGFTSGGFHVGGMDVTVWSEVLPSAGFGITTAIKSSFAYGIKNLFFPTCSDVQFSQIIERGNKLFLGISNCISDIFCMLYSEPNSCIVTDYSENSFERLPFDFEDVTILLTDTRVPRISVWDESTVMEPENMLLLGELKERKNYVYGGWQYDESPSEIDEVFSVINEDMRRKLKCIMLEHRYVLDSVAALKNKDFAKFCKAVSRSHDGMRDLYLATSPEIDWLVKRVQDFDQTSVRNPNGCSRVTGKGFGRCTYTILRSSDVELYKKKLLEYERIFSFHPICYEVKPTKGLSLCDFS